jgi:hypothetical protein
MSDFWWQCKDKSETMAGLVFGHLRTLDTQQSVRAAVNAENAALRWGKSVYGIGGPRNIGHFTYGNRTTAITENCLASVCQTAKAMIAANRPLPTFLTDGAEWTKQQHAKRLGKFVVGMYDRLKVYQKWTQGVDDAITFGTGAVKVHAVRGAPVAERTIIDDIIVDEQEARDCMPRQIHQRRYVDRDVLRHLYPGDKHAEAIARASAMKGVVPGGTRTTNLVEMVESWHLPSEEGADDGVYSACVENHCLSTAPYKHDYFPFVFYRWEAPITGFYGKGLVEDLTYLQMELDALNAFIRKCQRLVVRPMIFGDYDQRMPSAFFENNIAQFFRTKGARPPTFYTPTALGAETYNERERLVKRMFDLAGIGEMSAQGKKQPGVESGVAIRAVNDIQQGRFAIQAESFEDAHLETAQRLVWCMKDIDAKDRGKLVVAFRAKRFVETIDWNSVDPKEDVFTVDIEAQSIFGRTPAGRLQSVMDLFQMGMLDKPEALHVLDAKDLERAQDINDAAFRYAEYAIERIQEGTFVPPEPFEDLNLCIKRTQMARLKAKLDGAPEDVLEMLQLRIDMAQRLLEDAAKPAQQSVAPDASGQPMGADPAMAAGMPGAPPQGVVPGAPLPGPGEPLPAI